MKKLFTLLVLLVAIVTGAQAADVITFAGATTKDSKTTALTPTISSTNANITLGTCASTCSTNGYIITTTDGKTTILGNTTYYLSQPYQSGSKKYWKDAGANFYGTFTIPSGYTYVIKGVNHAFAAQGSSNFTATISIKDATSTKYATSEISVTKLSSDGGTITSTAIALAEADWVTLSAGTYTINVTPANTKDSSTGKYFGIAEVSITGDLVAEGPAGAITPTITTETATVEEGKTVSALGFITAKNGTNTLTDVTYSNFAVSAGSEYVSVAADGTITGLTGGAGHTATITFDSDAVTDKYEKTEGNELTVNVVAAKQELTLAYSGDVELTAGQTFTPATLTATAGGNTVDVATLGLTYESSNTDLATVNATTGEVTLVAKATGTATIKAKLQDNATYSDTEASYTITVNKIPVPKFYIDGVEIANGATVADFTTGQTIVIEAPGYYIYSNWSSSDTKSKSDYYKDGGVKGQDSYKASTLTTGKRVLYAVAGDDEHAQGNSSDLAKVIFSNVTAGSIEVSISAAGYATLYYSSLPLAVPANVTAKTYKVDNGNIVVSKTYAAESVIPQGEPVVLEGAAGDYTFTVKKDESATKDANSMLKGLDAAGQTTGDGLFYKLAQKDGKVGFYWGAAEGAAFALQGDHHAYLVVPASTGAREFYAFSEEVSTGINSANVQTVNDNAPIYNLAGQKVSKGYKGIVIVNGRKMLNK